MPEVTGQAAAPERLDELIAELDFQRLRWEATLRQLPGGVLIVDSLGRIALTNDWMQKLLKHSLPDVTNYGDFGTMRGWEKPDGTSLSATDWPPIRSLRDGVTIDREEIVYNVDGQARVHLEVRSAPIRDMSQAIIAAATMFFDVTKQLQAEAELRASEEQYRAIFNKDVAANLILDARLRVLACNAAAAALFGFEDGEALLTRSSAGKFPSVADRSTIWNRILQSPEGKRRPIRLHRADGSGIVATGTFAAHRDKAGNIIEIHGHLAQSATNRRAERKIVRLTSQLLDAQTEERRKLSHDLHDSAGQTLSALGLNLGLLSAKWPDMPEEAAEYLSQCKELVQDCVQNIRTVSYSLHPPLLEELGIGAALRWYVEGFSIRTAISVSVETGENLERLTREMEVALFRIAQEALTNVHRHSGSKTAQVLIIREPNRIVLTISDQGKGIAASTSHGATRGDGVGLASIRQQLALINGYLEISNDQGTTLSALVPLRTLIKE